MVETSFKQFLKKEYQEWLGTSPYERARTCYLVHSVPQEEVEGLTRVLRERAEYLFVTSACAGFYEAWGASWERFVAVMAEV